MKKTKITKGKTDNEWTYEEFEPSSVYPNDLIRTRIDFRIGTVGDLEGSQIDTRIVTHVLGDGTVIDRITKFGVDGQELTVSEEHDDSPVLY